MNVLIVMKRYHSNLRGVISALEANGIGVLVVVANHSLAMKELKLRQIIVLEGVPSRAAIEAIFDDFSPTLLIQRYFAQGFRQFWTQAQLREVGSVLYDQDPVSVPVLDVIFRPLRVIRFWMTRFGNRRLVGPHKRVSPVFSWGIASGIKTPRTVYVDPPITPQQAPPSLRGKEPARVLTVAKLGQRRKRVEWLIRALKKSETPFELVIVGWKPLTPRATRSFLKIQKKIDNLGSRSALVTLQENLDFNEMCALYGSADIFALPSKREMFAISPLEAMSFGLPVLVGADGGATSYIRTNRQAQVFRARAEWDFRKKLFQLINNQNLRSEIGSHNLQTIKKFHTTDIFISKVLECANPDKRHEVPTRAEAIFFLPSLSIGGAEKVLTGIASSLSERKLDVLLVTATGSTPQITLPSHLRHLNLGKSSVSAAIPELTRVIRNMGPKYVFSGLTHANNSAIIASLLSRKAPRLVISERSTTRRPRAFAKISEQIHGLLRVILYPFADEIVVVSKELEREIRTGRLGRRSQLTAIPNPVDFEKLEQLGARDIPRNLDVYSAESPKILYVGRLVSSKGLDDLLHAFQTVLKSRPAHLLIVGTGNQYDHLERLAEKLGLRDSVEFVGAQANPYPYFQAADIFVLPSYYEGFPNVLLEALFFNLKIIASDCPTGPREILEDGKWGTLVPVGDRTALSEALISAIDSPKQASGRVRAGDFKLEGVVTKYMDSITGKSSE